MAKYILLEDVTDRGAAGTQGIRLRPAGGAGGIEVALNEQDLDDRDVAEARRDPRLLALSADMPVRLIAPLSATSDYAEVGAGRGTDARRHSDLGP